MCMQRLRQVYAVSVIKRTNINLDMDLVDQAARELGNGRTTDTVHEALRGVVARSRRPAWLSAGSRT